MSSRASDFSTLSLPHVLHPAMQHSARAILSQHFISGSWSLRYKHLLHRSFATKARSKAKKKSGEKNIAKQNGTEQKSGAKSNSQEKPKQSSSPPSLSSVKGSLLADVCGSKKELALLNSESSRNILGASRQHDLCTAPLMTRTALLATNIKSNKAQYGVLGEIMSTNSSKKGNVQDSRLYLNCNAPLSALVCGVQGSGKSHTVSTILENMFITGDKRIGSLSKPLCGLILHLGDGGKQSTPNEAAWIGSLKDTVQGVSAPKVKVFVSPSSLQTMKQVYKPLGQRVIVEPLYFTEDELDAQAFLSMMAIKSADSAPLYMRILLSLLRELGDSYSYKSFRKQLDVKRKQFDRSQDVALSQRLSLLETFMRKDGKKTSQVRFSKGQITIVDLSDPFIDPASACGIFEVVTRLFSRNEVDTGKVVVVDEAHKYLSAGTGVSSLTDSLLSLIREKRHKGFRVIISTQEPTVVPSSIIDLCSVIILHRFSSLAWWQHVVQHVAADFKDSDAFDRVVKLQTGESIILAPSGLTTRQTGNGQYAIEQFGRSYLHGRVRDRITKDGGGSVLVI